MNLHQFRFVQEAARRNLNLTEAAKALHTSQPGVSKAIIAIRDEKRFLLLYNPVITMHSLTYYDTEEGCLSLAGKRPCRRYDWVEVKYEDEDFHKKRKRFQGFTAEIIQHEMDHLEGILI